MDPMFLAGYLAASRAREATKRCHGSATSEAQEAWERLTRPQTTPGFEDLVKLIQATRRKETIPYDEFDPECVELCRAINVLPGVYTCDSCCGHGAEPFRIFLCFDAADVRGLVLLTRALDHRYSPGPRWVLDLSITDVADPRNLAHPISIRLSSPEGVRGSVAYQQAHELADHIAIHLNHPNFLHGFGLDSLKGLLPIPDSAPEWMRDDARGAPKM